MLRTTRAGLASAFKDLTGAFVPVALRELDRELRERLAKVPTPLNEYGYDRFGFSPEAARKAFLPAALFYRHYFRVETYGIEKIPSGRALLVGNHAGQLPFDAVMLGTACLLGAEPPRVLRSVAEFWIPRIPWFGVLVSRGGGLVGTPENCAAMLEAGECVLMFPEGARGMNKPYSERYKLQRFGPGFMRLALATHTPVVPVALIGSEEQQPGFTNLHKLGKLFGFSSLPVTLGFPWLGPLGILPLPVKYRFYFGDPLQFEGDAHDEDAAIEARVDTVKAKIVELLEHGRRARRGVFF